MIEDEAHEQSEQPDIMFMKMNLRLFKIFRNDKMWI